MSKRKHADQSDKWKAFYNKVSGKRTGKKSGSGDSTLEFLTVQRLSAEVEGKCQKYTRIGALTMVPFGQELSMENIKKACSRHFNVSKYMECDVLAGERGPSYTDVKQITNWKQLHVRFIEKNDKETLNVDDDESRDSRPVRAGLSSRGDVSRSSGVGLSSFHSVRKEFEAPMRSHSSPCKSNVPASVPLSAVMNFGKFIPPKPSRGLVTLQLEYFSVEDKKWLDPFDVRVSLSNEKFASGGFRDAFECTALSGLNGKFVLKKYIEDNVPKILQHFESLDIHTRKVVQMHALARHFTKCLSNEITPEFGASFLYNKLYYSKLDEQSVTIEPYLHGKFTKYINNTGEIIVSDGSDLAMKAETLSHYTYEKSGKRLMVLDIQGASYSLCDPEIASTQFTDDEDNILFCNGNLSRMAIDTFLSQHVCNKFCELLCLDKK